MGFNLNVFQIWKEHGELVPFAVRRHSWNPLSFFIVTSVEIKNFPYGNASGYFISYKNAKPTEDGYFEIDLTEIEKKESLQGLSCAGCYQWEYVPLRLYLNNISKKL